MGGYCASGCVATKFRFNNLRENAVRGISRISVLSDIYLLILRCKQYESIIDDISRFSVVNLFPVFDARCHWSSVVS